MKTFLLSFAALLFGLTIATTDAEAARRLGSGKSSGMQREAVAPKAPSGATAPAAAPNAAKPPMAAPQPQPQRSWLGPIAGLAAGIGLAALASHLGFGQGLANFLMIALIVMAGIAVIGFIMRRRAAAQQPALAGAGAPLGQSFEQGPADAHSAYAPLPSAAGGGASPAGNIPADFDVDGFTRAAKVNFIRLQAANDAGNIDDIREFTTPEMYGELKLALAERGAGAQETDVVAVNAEVLDVAEEANRYVVSVRFNGQIRENRGTPEPFDEIWHMTKPRDGSHGWVLAGIQQLQ